MPLCHSSAQLFISGRQNMDIFMKHVSRCWNNEMLTSSLLFCSLLLLLLFREYACIRGRLLKCASLRLRALCWICPENYLLSSVCSLSKLKQHKVNRIYLIVSEWQLSEGSNSLHNRMWRTPQSPLLFFVLLNGHTQFRQKQKRKMVSLTSRTFILSKKVNEFAIFK